jgi:hypothetical protein
VRAVGGRRIAALEGKETRAAQDRKPRTREIREEGAMQWLAEGVQRGAVRNGVQLSESGSERRG